MFMQTRLSVWERWKALARRAAELQATVILGGLYYVVLVPMAIMRRPFAVRATTDRGPAWSDLPPTDHDLASARRQF
jgi:hypothetical protein